MDDHPPKSAEERAEEAIKLLQNEGSKLVLEKQRKEEADLAKAVKKFEVKWGITCALDIFASFGLAAIGFCLYLAVFGLGMYVTYKSAMPMQDTGLLSFLACFGNWVGGILFTLFVLIVMTGAFVLYLTHVDKFYINIKNGLLKKRGKQ